MVVGGKEMIGEEGHRMENDTAVQDEGLVVHLGNHPAEDSTVHSSLRSGRNETCHTSASHLLEL